MNYKQERNWGHDWEAVTWSPLGESEAKSTLRSRIWSMRESGSTLEEIIAATGASRRTAERYIAQVVEWTAAHYANVIAQHKAAVRADYQTILANPPNPHRAENHDPLPFSFIVQSVEDYVPSLDAPVLYPWTSEAEDNRTSVGVSITRDAQGNITHRDGVPLSKYKMAQEAKQAKSRVVSIEDGVNEGYQELDGVTVEEASQALAQEVAA